MTVAVGSPVVMVNVGVVEATLPASRAGGTSTEVASMVFVPASVPKTTTSSPRSMPPGPGEL